MLVPTTELVKMSEDELLSLLDKEKNKALALRLKLSHMQNLPPAKPSAITLEESVVTTSTSEQVEEENPFEDAVEFYLDNLDALTTISSDSEIMHLLPSKNNTNYKDILLRLKLEINKKLTSINVVTQEFTDLTKEELEYIKGEIILQQRKIAQIDLALQDTSVLTAEKVSNKLIFVPTPNGNIRLLEDFNVIASDYNQSFFSLLDSIQKGTFKNVKRFTSSNAKTSGISEVRDIGTGARILFDRIGPDTYAIITGFIKKTMSNKGYQEQLENRIQNYRNMLPGIQSLLGSEEFEEEQSKIEKEVWSRLKPEEKKGKRCKKKQ